VTIRPATEVDAEAISRLVTGLAKRFITPDYSPEGADTLLSHLTPEAIENVMNQGTRYWVAEDMDGIVGVVGVTSSAAHLYHLFVAESHHRRGLGQLLWEHLRGECVRDGHPGVFTVNSSLYAVPFYRSLGFVNTGSRDEKSGVICQPMRWETG
jgi:GNAT superfamily N-acetyltransferase